jgi:hypothetical protein
MDCRSFKRDERYRASYVTFFDNHDEQRLASPEFAGTAEKGKPLMVVSTISSFSHNDYFGQEVGEAANENAGFGTFQNFNFLIMLCQIINDG